MQRRRLHRYQTALAICVLLGFAFVPSTQASHWHECMGETVTMRGSVMVDVIQGTHRRDVIVGQGGGDTIYGNGGNDIICGNKGDDTIIGGDGTDRAAGGGGTDFCSAERRRSCES